MRLPPRCTEAHAIRAQVRSYKTHLAFVGAALAAMVWFDASRPTFTPGTAITTPHPTTDMNHTVKPIRLLPG